MSRAVRSRDNIMYWGFNRGCLGRIGNGGNGRDRCVVKPCGGSQLPTVVEKSDKAVVRTGHEMTEQSVMFNV